MQPRTNRSYLRLMSFAPGDRVHFLRSPEFDADGNHRVLVVHKVENGRALVAPVGAKPQGNGMGIMYSSVALEALCAEGTAPDVRVELEPEASDPFAPAPLTAPLEAELRAALAALAERAPQIASPPRVLGFRHVGKPELSMIAALVAAGHVEVLRSFGRVADPAGWKELLAFTFEAPGDKDPTTHEPGATFVALAELDDVVVVRVFTLRVAVGRHAIAGWTAFAKAGAVLRMPFLPARPEPRVAPARRTSTSTIIERRLGDDDLGRVAYGTTRAQAAMALLGGYGLLPSLEPRLANKSERSDAVHAVLTRLYAPRAVFVPTASGYEVVAWGGAGTDTYLLLAMSVAGKDPLHEPATATAESDTNAIADAARAWLSQRALDELAERDARLAPVDTPPTVREALRAWRWISDEDSGSGRAYRVDAATPFILLLVTTDGDDRYLEIYDLQGRACAGVVSPDGITDEWSEDVDRVRKAAREVYAR